MKQIIFFLFLLLPALAFAQWPASPNKIRLGNQTTGDGLIYRSDSLPGYTPNSRNNAWLHFDTVAKKLYFYEGGTWQEYASGSSLTAGSGIQVVGDSINWNGDLTQETNISARNNILRIGLNADYAGNDNAIMEIFRLAAGGRAGFFFEAQKNNYNDGYAWFLLQADTATQKGTFSFYAQNAAGTRRSVVSSDLAPIAGTSGGPLMYSQHGTAPERFNVFRVDSLGLQFSNSTLSPTISYRFPRANPSLTLGDTTVFAQIGTGAAATPAWVPLPSGGAGTGTVTSITAGSGLTGGTITTTGTIAADTAVLATVYALGDSISTRVTGTGTTGTIPVWSSTTALGDSPLTVTGTDVTAGGTGFFLPPVGTTAQRPGAPTAGMTRYNSTNGALEYYGASAWEVPVKSATATGLGTNTQVGVFDANGRLSSSSNFTHSVGSVTITRTQIPNINLSKTTGGTRNYRFTIGASNGYLNAFVFGTSFSSDTALLQNTTTNKLESGLMIAGTAPSLAENTFQNSLSLMIAGRYWGATEGLTEGIGMKNIRRSINRGDWYNSLYTFGGNNADTESEIKADSVIVIVQSGNVGFGNTDPQRTLHVTGEVRITDLTTDTPTRIVGADADGDLGAITVGTGLDLTAGVLTATSGSGDVSYTDSLTVFVTPTQLSDSLATVPTLYRSDGTTTSDRTVSLDNKYLYITQPASGAALYIDTVVASIVHGSTVVRVLDSLAEVTSPQGRVDIIADDAIRLIGDTLIVSIALPNDNTLNRVLMWDSTNNEVKYRDASSLGGGGGVQYADSLTTFVTPTQLSDSLTTVPTIYTADGALTGNRTISGDFILTKSGVQDNSYIFDVNNTGTTSTGIRSQGASTGLRAIGNATAGIWSESTTLPFLGGNTATGSTNAVVSGLHLQRNGSFVGDVGNGISINLFARNSSNQSVEAARIQSVMTDVVAASSASRLEFYTRQTNVVTNRKMALAGSGQLTLDEYGAGTFTGTAVNHLAVTASGSVVEYAVESPRDTVLKTADFTAAKGEISLVDCSAGVIIVTPPATPVAGDWFAVSDARAASATYNITIDFDSAGQNLYGSAQNYVLNANGAYVKITYVADGTGWITTK